MIFLFNLTYFFGYFLIMIVFSTIAIILSKSKKAWIWYSIGALFQLLALYGNQLTADVYNKDTTIQWTIYFLLLIITAIIIFMRYAKVNNRIWFENMFGQHMKKCNKPIENNTNNLTSPCINENIQENIISKKHTYLVCIFDATTHTLRKEKKDIDIVKFPPSKFANNDTYYAIETFRDEKKVRIYCTKDNWNKQIEIGISEEDK